MVPAAHQIAMSVTNIVDKDRHMAIINDFATSGTRLIDIEKCFDFEAGVQCVLIFWSFWSIVPSFKVTTSTN